MKIQVVFVEWVTAGPGGGGDSGRTSGGTSCTSREEGRPGGVSEAVSYLGEELGLRKVVVCCGRGMVSEGNLDALKEAGLSYIVAIRMRKDKELAQAVLSHPGRYREVAENLKVKEVPVPGEEDRYILCEGSLGAEEDRRAREAIVAYLAEKLPTGNVKGLLKGAARRYVRVQGGRRGFTEVQSRRMPATTPSGS